MSGLQDSHRPFLFGNPFRMISLKGSQLPPKLLAILNSFEETMAERLKKLIPKQKDEILSLKWMKSAIDSLCETFTDMQILIIELDLPVSDWDQKWIDVYLDISLKLLDICTAFSSELSRLNQGHLILQLVVQNLESKISKQISKAHFSFHSWREHICSKNPRIEECRRIIDSIAESLDLPKVRKSTKGKVLMRAMYGVKVQTVFVCSIFAAALSGSKDLSDLTIPSTTIWAQAFSDLQIVTNEKVQDVLSHGKLSALKELEAVDSIVKELSPMIQDGVEPTALEAVQNSLVDLKRIAKELSQGLDTLAKEVDRFFKIVLTGRDALLCNLRTSSTTESKLKGSNLRASNTTYTKLMM